MHLRISRSRAAMSLARRWMRRPSWRLRKVPVAVDSWFLSAVCSTTALARAVTSSANSSMTSEAGARTAGAITAANCASTRASSRSVLARTPQALANMRTRNGSTTATGTIAPCRLRDGAIAGEYAMTTNALSWADPTGKQDSIPKYKNAHALRYDNVTRVLLGLEERACVPFQRRREPKARFEIAELRAQVANLKAETDRLVEKITDDMGGLADRLAKLAARAQLP